MSTTTVVIVALLLALTVFAVLFYNRLIRLRNQFENAFSQIDVQLQRRYELIPNLVETASAYLKHESETLTAVTEARNIASEKCSKARENPGSGSSISELSAADGVLSGLLGRLNVVMESYPDLKADTAIQDLHEELSSTENRVAFSRQAFNDAVMRYNTACEEFPSVLVARMFAFRQADLFVVEDKEIKKPVRVSFTHQSRAA
ncbi:MAG: LemA family protein [Granulosicoccus sp.]|nr:LemA family protein [Granulosicoccus sp.]